jgi:glutaminyl-peptide cyclotransferase
MWVCDMRETLPLVVGKRKCLVSSLLCVVAAGALFACGGGEEASEPGGAAARFDQRRAMGDLRAQVRVGPRPAGSVANRRLVRLLARRLRRAGARDVRIQHPHRNVVGRIPGTEPGAIVIGAHHDTKDGIPGFVGANDGASGVAVVLELARALDGRVDGPSVHLAMFDAEEARGDREFAADGARGSRQYVRNARRGRQGSPRLADIRAMVLLDLVGDCDLRIPREADSDPGLYRFLAEAGERTAGSESPFEGTAAPILDDHTPFANAGVPALDVIDLTFGPGPTPGGWWHTPQDRLDRVCASSLGAVGRATLGALPEIGRR